MAQQAPGAMAPRLPPPPFPPARSVAVTHHGLVGAGGAVHAHTRVQVLPNGALGGRGGNDGQDGEAAGGAGAGGGGVDAMRVRGRPQAGPQPRMWTGGNAAGRFLGAGRVPATEGCASGGAPLTTHRATEPTPRRLTAPPGRRGARGCMAWNRVDAVAKPLAHAAASSPAGARVAVRVYQPCRARRERPARDPPASAKPDSPRQRDSAGSSAASHVTCHQSQSYGLSGQRFAFRGAGEP
jgi:hypothetical protein